MLLDKPVVSPILVGRAPYVESLRRLLSQARSGHGRVALISGEAGIGKTRLVAEAKTEGRREGFLFLQGQCFEQDRAVPYAPLLDLLRTFIATRSADQVAHLFAPAAVEVVKLLPELASLLHDAPSPPQLEPEEEKRRLFRGLIQLFPSLATVQPLLLVFEDLHWSDDTSLEFLLRLARRIDSQQTLLLLTYRSEELRPVLNHFLAELDREHLAVELRLSPLTPEQVDAMLAAIFDLLLPVRREFLDALFGLTEGNPFFIEQVLESLMTAGEIFYKDGRWDRKPLDELHIPRSLQDAVRRRTGNLSEAASNLLRLAAVMGQRIDFSVLPTLTSATEQELFPLMKELLAAQLLIEESPEQFSFRHALARQAIYSELLARERQIMHRNVAETMERLYRGTPRLDEHAADLAYHFGEAAVWPLALEYSRRAAARAQALYAYHEEIKHLTRALEIAQTLAVGSLAQLYRARGQSYETLGDFEAARHDYEEAGRCAREGQDGMAEWQSLIDLGSLWASRDYEQSGQCFRRALDLAQRLNNPSAIGHSLNRLGNWHLNVEQPLEALRCHQQALEIFQQYDDARGVTETLDLLGRTSIVRGDLRTSLEYYAQVAARCREANDQKGLAEALLMHMLSGGNYRAETEVPGGLDWAESLEEGESALEITRRIAWRSGEAFALVRLGYRLGWKGEYGRALEMARLGLAVGTEVEHRQWVLAAHWGLGALMLDLLAPSSARRHLEEALNLARSIGSWNWIRGAAGVLASAYVLENEPARAEALLDSVIAANAPSLTMGHRRCWYARAELAMAQGNPGSALRIVQDLLSSAANLTSTGTGSIPLLQKLRGQAMAAMGDLASAEVVLQAAKQAAQIQGQTPILWRVHVALGQIYQAAKRREEAYKEFSAAWTIVESLASGIPQDAAGAEGGRSLRDQYLERASALIPRVAPSPRRAAKIEYGGLTERERAVAGLVARGKSNREIAHILVISERTVGAHIGNILSKLGFSSRTQIAAWAIEKGLVNT